MSIKIYGIGENTEDGLEERVSSIEKLSKEIGSIGFQNEMRKVLDEFAENYKNEKTNEGREKIDGTVGLFLALAVPILSERHRFISYYLQKVNERCSNIK